MKLVVIKKGSLLISLHGKQIPVGSPALLMLNESDAITIVSDLKAVVQNILFDPVLINSAFTTAALLTGYKNLSLTEQLDHYLMEPFIERNDYYAGIIPVTETHKIALEKLSDALSREIDEKNYKWPCRSRSYLIEMLFYIQAIYLKKGNNVPVLIDDPDGKTAAALLYIQTHFSEKLTIEQIARESNSNRTTLMRNFKSVTGETVIAYITKLKIQFAIELLKTTTLDINEIAARAGFDDPNYFRRIFKKLHNKTPGVFRESIR